MSEDHDRKRIKVDNSEHVQRHYDSKKEVLLSYNSL